MHSKSLLICIIAATAIGLGSGTIIKKKLAWIPIKALAGAGPSQVYSVPEAPAVYGLPEPSPVYGAPEPSHVYAAPEPVPVYGPPSPPPPPPPKPTPIIVIPQVLEKKSLFKPSDLLSVWDAVKERVQEYNPITKFVKQINVKPVIVPVPVPKYKLIPDVAYTEVNKVKYVPVLQKEYITTHHKQIEVPSAPYPRHPVPSGPYPPSHN